MDILTVLNTTWLGPTTALVLGLLLGSFFNVCIRRIPEDEEIVFTASHCPRCKTPIRWFDNLPVLSFLFLRGKCRACKAPISWEYPAVELASGALFLWLFLNTGASAAFLAYGVFLSLLLVISVIDLHHRIIPNELSYPGMALGIGAALWLGNPPWYSAVIGWFVGGFIFWLVAFTYEKLTGREGLGGGDIKMLAMLGAWLGADAILIVIVLSTGLGSIVGIGALLLQKGNLKLAIPFGPFLAVAAFIYLFWGHHVQSFLLPPIN